MTFTEKYMKPFEGEGKSASEVFELGMSLAVKDLGFDNLILYLPCDEEILRRKYREDKDLNSIPIKKWDTQASLIRFLLKNRGVTVYSLSQRVSVLKKAAEMLCEGKSISCTTDVHIED